MIKVNVEKAKVIAHDIRKADRAEKMAPLDAKATIPMEAEAAETERQVIRDTNAAVQVQIDSATNEVELKAAITAL